MLVNLQDPTPLTLTEALVLVLEAHQYVANDVSLPIRATGYATMELRAAEYRIRKESVAKKVESIR